MYYDADYIRALDTACAAAAPASASTAW